VKNFELDLVRKDGTIATVWTNSRWTAGGQPFGMDGVLRDVTQAKKDAEQKRSLEESLRQNQKMQAIGQLAGGIAHDFNNMLSVIIGFTEIVLQDLPPDGLDAQNLAQVLGAGERARRLVAQILTFSRGGSVEKSAIRLGPIVHEVLDFLKMTIPSSVTISAELRKETGVVVADATQIHEAVMNLASNAVHAMGGRGVLSVGLSEEYLDAAVSGRIGAIGPGVFSVLEVRDTGIGMEKALIDKAFEPFFTTKPVGEGTGMGLSVVYGIMRDHGGDIVVESSPGKGTSMKLYFPRIEAEPAGEPGDGAAILGGTERILFVDDEAMIVDLTKKLLATFGYRVTAMTDPVRARDLLAADPLAFDLLITDHNMPVMTGIELAREAIALNAALPVILCTGYGSPVSEEEAMAAGVRRICMKPARKTELGQAIRHVLDGSATLRGGPGSWSLPPGT
jgi:signal transduction histidine kinase/ActR/RegA family two-component response regulator